MPQSRIEAHLFPNDVFKTSRCSPEERMWLLGRGYGASETMIGKKPSAMEEAPPEKPVHPLTCRAVLERLWDIDEELQGKVLAALEESLRFEEVKANRARMFNRIDYENIGVGKGIGETVEISRFDVVLNEQVTPTAGVDWAAGLGEAPKAVTDPVSELRLNCPVCDFFEPWSNHAARSVGQHVHRHHPEKKKEWKEYLKNWKRQHGFS